MERLLLLFLLPLLTNSFLLPFLLPQRTTTIQTSLSSSSPNKGDETSTSSSSSSILLQSDSSNLLNVAFESLQEEDKYDAVLTGLCAKILDEGYSLPKINDVMKLMIEMNDRNVAASVRSVSALIDAGAKSESPLILSTVLSLCIRNGGITQFGSLQNNLKPVPSNIPYLILKDVPTDERTAEVAAALSFSFLLFICLIVSNTVGSGPLLLGPSAELDGMLPFLANTILYGMLVIGVLDNFYDALVALLKGVEIIVRRDFVNKMPKKEELPLGLGEGDLTGSVGRGLGRLLSVDTERECESEAAAFFAAYSLGLPCFAFRPNALEAAVLVFESIQPHNSTTPTALSPLLSNAGITKILIWLMAPISFESMKHTQLLYSDPRTPRGFLQRLKENSPKMNVPEQKVLDIIGEDEENLLKWAYGEAETLMRENKKVVEELAQRLAGGVATVGDCVAVMEGWE